jgi:hypothetical protein
VLPPWPEPLPPEPPLAPLPPPPSAPPPQPESAISAAAIAGNNAVRPRSVVMVPTLYAIAPRFSPSEARDGSWSAAISASSSTRSWIRSSSIQAQLADLARGRRFDFLLLTGEAFRSEHLSPEGSKITWGSPRPGARVVSVSHAAARSAAPWREGSRFRRCSRRGSWPRPERPRAVKRERFGDALTTTKESLRARGEAKPRGKLCLDARAEVGQSRG